MTRKNSSKERIMLIQQNKSFLRVKMLGLFILIGSCFTSKIYGSYAPIPFGQVVHNADLIIIGELTCVESISMSTKLKEQPDLRWLGHVGEIKVTKVLKGEISKSAIIKLVWPDLGAEEKALLQSSPPRISHSSCPPHVIYKEGDSGI